MQSLMSITRTQVPKLIAQVARTTTTSNAAPLLCATSVAARNYSGSSQKHSTAQEIAHAFEPIKTKDIADDAWRPAEPSNRLKELESGDLNLSDSNVLGVSVDMEALKDTKEATESWTEEVKEYSEETAKQASNLGSGFAQTATGFTTTSLKDSAAEMVAPYAAATSSIGTIATEKIGELEEKLEWVQKKASEDTHRQEQKISNAADYVTEKIAEVKDDISKSTSEWTTDAKHKIDEAVHHQPHLKDYAAKAGEIMKEKAAEVYEKVASTVHRAKESIAGDHHTETTASEQQTEIKDGVHYINTEKDLHVEKEMAEEWSPEKPTDFEVPKQKQIS